MRLVHDTLPQRSCSGLPKVVTDPFDLDGRELHGADVWTLCGLR